MAYNVAATNTLDKPVLQGLATLSSTAAHDLGYEVEANTGQKYEYVFISTNMTATPGGSYPAFFLAQTAGTNGKTVTTTHQSDLARSFAGLLCAAAKAGNNYVWIQTAGYAPSTYVSTCVAAGNVLTSAATGSLDIVLATAVSTALAGVTYSLTNVRSVAVALEADSSGLADVMLIEH